MADAKISALTDATAITDTDYLVIVDDVGGTPTTKRLDAADAKTYFQTGAHLSGGTDVPVADGGTGASDAATARTNLGALGNVVEDTTPQLGATLDAQGYNIENAGAIESNVNTVGTSGATETLDVSLYGVHDITMDQACTFTFSNPAPSGDASIFVLILRGAFTPTLPASVDWADGSAPTYTTPSVYTFTTIDGGTTWLGAQVGKAFA